MMIPTFCSITSNPQSLSFVPQPNDFKEAYQRMGEDEKRATYLSLDGFRYSVRTNRLFVPKSLRESFWFHGSRFGGHLGVGRTVRRLQQWVWWPGLAQDARKYISGCLICVKRHQRPAFPSLSGVLSRPAPFQLISLDYVGPRNVHGVNYWYLVSIDHYSRFVVTDAISCPPTAAHVVEFLATKWLPYFRELTTVLTDRGSVFKANEFRDYVVIKLCSYMMYTSPYHPAGNGINEASHRGLDATIAAAFAVSTTSFTEALRDATTIHNCTPHSGTGISPYFALYGQEAPLPGLQSWHSPIEEYRVRSTEHRLRMQYRVFLEKEGPKMHHCRDDVKLGDWVCDPINPSDIGTVGTGLPNKYTPSWSLPAKIMEIRK